MAIDPGQLQAFANEGGEEGGPPPVEDEGNNEEEEMEEGGEGRFAALIPLLEEFRDDVEALTDEVDYDALADLGAEMSPQDMEILKAGLGTLDPRLLDELKSSLGSGISEEEAMEVGEHLESEDMVSDAARLAGWLTRIASLVGSLDG